MDNKEIKEIILRFMEEKNLNMSTLSNLMGTSRAALKPAIDGGMITLKALDAFTEVTGNPPGYYYIQFLKDSLIKPHWTRLKLFVKRCSELNRLDCIELLMQGLSEQDESLKQIGTIFDFAEELYEQSFTDASVILYNTVIQIEKSHQSERFAVCLLRLFQIHRSDPKQGLIAAIQFAPYRHRVPMHHVLDGLIALSFFHVVHDYYEEARVYADELRKKSYFLYHHPQIISKDFKPLRPLVYYMGMSHLIQETILLMQNRYREAMEWIAGYEDLSWVIGLDEQGKREVELFSMYAYGNKLALQVLLGDEALIPEYVKFLKENPDEQVKGLKQLLEAAINYGYDISDILVTFDKLDSEDQKRYSVEVQTMDDVLLHEQYVYYCLKQQDYSTAIAKIFECIKVSIAIDKKDIISDMLSLFNTLRDHATDTQILQFDQICRRIWDEKNHGLDLHTCTN